VSGAEPGRRLTVAVIGAGLMGRWHASYAVRAGARVASVVDRDPDAAHRLASRHRGASAYPDLAAMLEATLPDAAHVCTPTGTHAEIARRLLTHGMHVLVEKPLAGSLDETEALLRDAEAHAVLVCPVYQFPFQRGFERARERLAAMGRAIRAELTVCSAGGDRLRGGGDALVQEILPHLPSILCALLQETPDDLATWRAVRVGEGEFAADGRFGSVYASVSISAHARPPRCEARLFCERGTLLLDFLHGYLSVQRDRAGRSGKIVGPFAAAASQSLAAAGNLARRFVVREPAYPGLMRLISAFYAAARGGKHWPVPRETILSVARWCDHVERQIRVAPH
jgi:predicted dehydrogenase